MKLNPSVLHSTVIVPSLNWVKDVTGVEGQRRVAERFLLAVAIQETDLSSRYQVLSNGEPGPARGWWQMEMPTVALLFRHPQAGPMFRALCNEAWVQQAPAAAWRAMEGHDRFACAAARLLLWCDPAPIPTEQEAAWECYVNRVWRPGKPHKHKWGTSWGLAVGVVG